MPLRVGTAPVGIASTSHGVGSSRSRPGSMPPSTGIDATPGQADPTKCGVVPTPTGIDAPNRQDDASQTRERPFSSGVDASQRPKRPGKPANDPTPKHLDATCASVAPKRNEYGLRFVGIGVFSPDGSIERTLQNEYTHPKSSLFRTVMLENADALDRPTQRSLVRCLHPSSALS